jgi:hypothetical protein
LHDVGLYCDSTACSGSSSSSSTGGPLGPGVVLGIDELNSHADVISLYVATAVNGLAFNYQTFGPPSGQQYVSFPMELPFLGLGYGEPFEVFVEARGPGSVMPFMTRYARTTGDGRTTLLRVLLNDLCSYAAPCGATTTCVYGECLDPFLPPAALEDYSPDWAKYSYCKPKSPGAPTFVLGTGESAYAPLNDMDTVSLHTLGQGGHHIWIGMRMKNFTQTSTVTLTGHVPGQNLDVGPDMYQATFFDEPALGFCDTFGFTFVVDAVYDYSLYLGQQMQITATITDGDGQTATDTKLVNIAPTVAP